MKILAAIYLSKTKIPGRKREQVFNSKEIKLC